MPVDLDYRRVTIAVYRHPPKRIIVYDRSTDPVVSAAILYRPDEPLPWAVLWSPPGFRAPLQSLTWGEACGAVVGRLEDGEARRWVGRVLGVPPIVAA